MFQKFSLSLEMTLKGGAAQRKAMRTPVSAIPQALISGEPGQAQRRTLGHPFDLCALIDVGDIPFAIAEDCVRTIGREIIRAVHDWDLGFRDRATLEAAAE